MEAKELSPLDGFNKGDIAVISDPDTQEEFGATRVKFNITSARIFANTSENVKITGYVLGLPSDSDIGDEDGGETLMLVVAEIAGFYDITLYFLDNKGDLEYEQGSDSPNYGDLIDPKDNTFADLIVLNDRNGDGLLRWERLGDSYMNLSYHNEAGVQEASLCNYITSDDNYGNDLALVICEDREDARKVEMWYGYKLQDHEAELFPEGTEF